MERLEDGKQRLRRAQVGREEEADALVADELADLLTRRLALREATLRQTDLRVGLVLVRRAVHVAFGEAVAHQDDPLRPQAVLVTPDTAKENRDEWRRGSVEGDAHQPTNLLPHALAPIARLRREAVGMW
eukprot:6177941-Pleurochrysis_carterae.AAC.2